EEPGLAIWTHHRAPGLVVWGCLNEESVLCFTHGTIRPTAGFATRTFSVAIASVLNRFRVSFRYDCVQASYFFLKFMHLIQLLRICFASFNSAVQGLQDDPLKLDRFGAKCFGIAQADHHLRDLERSAKTRDGSRDFGRDH